jgi:hypothetical protein
MGKPYFLAAKNFGTGVKFAPVINADLVTSLKMDATINEHENAEYKIIFNCSGELDPICWYFDNSENLQIAWEALIKHLSGLE